MPAKSDPAREEFRDEFKRVWDRLPDKGMFFGLLAAWVLLFHFLGNSTFGYENTASLFRWLYVAYNSPNSDDGHGNLIPFVVLALFWWKREELLAVRKANWWPALLLLAVAAVLHVAGYLFQQPRISVAAFFIGAFALMGVAWGMTWLRASLFPYALFVFCMPIGSLADTITFPLRMLVTSISSGLCQTVLGIEVIRDGTRLLDPTGKFQYDVAAACSGIRSLTALLALTTIYGFVTFKSPWKRALMVAIALPLAVVGNVVRITSVVVAAKSFGEDVGLKVHDWLGFVTFAIAIVCVMLLSWWLREDEPKPAPELQAA